MKVYIDGENCRKGLVRVLVANKIISGSRDMTSFPVKDLLADVIGDDSLDISYYASKIKLPNGYTPSKEILQHVHKIQEYTRKWVPCLERQGIEYVKAGSLKVKSSKACGNCTQVQDVLQEKGVDVRIASDILEDVYAKKEKTIVLMSSDTDLCPALHKAKARGAKVVYVCFADAPNRAISAVANETISISLAKIQKYAKVATK